MSSTIDAPALRVDAPSRRTRFLTRIRDAAASSLRGEKLFLAVLVGTGALVAASYDVPHVAMWLGFAIAGYSAIANDSIQTLGTFIASNRAQRWWVLWLFAGGIWLATIGASWLAFDGDVTHQRLAAKGFGDAPTSFSFMQVAAPLVLLVLTRLKMPVSTTFLLLSSFAAGATSVASVATKSLAGYGVAFAVAAALWLALTPAMTRWFSGTPHRLWRPLQWVTSGALWSIWIQQDAANVAVYLPRSLDVWQLVAFAGVGFLGLGLVFRRRGERVQEIVDEKSSVVDVRAATIIDVVYAALLYVFKIHSNVPMSTTWVFLGLLAGRELAMALRNGSGRSWKDAARLLAKDVGLASVGLVVSLALAYAANDGFRAEVNGLLGA